jgi:hypothetical protein
MSQPNEIRTDTITSPNNANAIAGDIGNELGRTDGCWKIRNLLSLGKIWK